MIVNKLDFIEFRLKELHDFTWLKKYGTAFWAVDETGSGCICIGMEKEDKKYFCKIAGVNITETEVSPKESVRILKESVPLYMIFQQIEPLFAILIYSKKLRSLMIKELNGLEQND